MPFKKLANGKYKSPSGRILTGSQVKAYYAKKRKTTRRTPKRKRHPIGGMRGMGG